MKYYIGVCDDEKYQLSIDGVYIREIAKRRKWDIELIGFTGKKQVLSYAKQKALDILFLDIDLGEDSGIMLADELEALKPDLVVIFITGHREFANDAYDVEAIGYIVKPVDEKKLERIFEKAILQVSALKSSKPESTLVITEENIKKKILQSEIRYIERQLSKSVIHTKEKRYQVYETITALYERLDSRFVRVNQSEIINMDEIEQLKESKVFLKNGNRLSVGRTYAKELKEKYYQYPH